MTASAAARASAASAIWTAPGRYARCTREEQAGGLPQNARRHLQPPADGDCRCGQTHGDARPGGRSPPRRHAEQPPQAGRAAVPLVFHAGGVPPKKRYGEGTPVTPWIYREPAGEEAFRVLRIDYRAPDGSKAKSYRPCHQAADGRWLLSRPAGLLPLYNLPAILAAPPEAIIAVLEGEKCTDIAAALGLPHATTSAHGAKAPQLTDWSPLAGRSVAILRDDGERRRGIRLQGRRHPGCPRSPRPRPHRVPARTFRRRRHRAVDRRPPTPPASPTPKSSPSCVP